MENNNFDDEKKTILIVDDEQKIVDLLVHNLTREGYNTIEANDGQTAIDFAISQRPDLILLDVMIPRVDGLTVCKKIKNYYNVPILMVSAKDDELDKIVGLEIGADDYITKPYNPTILLLRIQNIFKRINQNNNALKYKDIIVDLNKSELKKDDKVLVLTKNEMIIFSYLLNNKEKIVSRDELMTYLWNNEEYINDNALTVNISRLRSKLSNFGYENIIETRKGQGYILL